MKTYETKHIPASSCEKLALTTCDLCGKTTTNRWKDGCFNAVETEVSIRTGSNYPEGGSGEITEIDICPTCFEDKLIPWVRSQGGEPTTKEWEW